MHNYNNIPEWTHSYLSAPAHLQRPRATKKKVKINLTQIWQAYGTAVEMCGLCYSKYNNDKIKQGAYKNY